MILRSSDLQSDSNLDSIRNSCDVLKTGVVEVTLIFDYGCSILVINSDLTRAKKIYPPIWQLILLSYHMLLRFGQELKAEVWF